jgi:DNA helicase-4
LPVAKTAPELIEDLITHWACWDDYEVFYLTVLAPRLVISPQSGDETERLILSALRPQLSEMEWNELPQMIAEKRKGVLREIESERLRREEEARERIRQDQIRKQA